MKEDHNPFVRKLYLLGIGKMLTLLKEHEAKEDFETCQQIKEAIEQHNRLAGDNLPTVYA